MSGMQQMMISSVPTKGTFSYGFDSTDSSDNSIHASTAFASGGSKFMSLYKVQELNQYGARAGTRFINLRWHITSAVNPTYSPIDFTVKIFHTPLNNASGLGFDEPYPIPGESKTTVFFSPGANTQFETVGITTLPFTSEFVWNGVNNIVVESCMLTCETGTVATSGGQKIINLSGSSDAYRGSGLRNSSGGGCSPTFKAFFTYTYIASIEMDWVSINQPFS